MLRYIIYTGFCFLISCSQSAKYKKVFSTPVVDTVNNLVGINDFKTTVDAAFSQRIHSIDSFGCSDNISCLVNLNNQLGKKFVTIKIPFRYQLADIDLGIIAHAEIAITDDSLLYADCFMYGSLYPNGGQETNSHYTCQDSILSFISSHAIQWYSFKMPANDNKNLLNPAFRFDKKNFEKQDQLFFRASNSATPLFLERADVISSLLATEFRLNFAQKKVSLKVWKNTKLIFDKNITFTESIIL